MTHYRFACWLAWIFFAGDTWENCWHAKSLPLSPLWRLSCRYCSELCFGPLVSCLWHRRRLIALRESYCVGGPIDQATPDIYLGNSSQALCVKRSLKETSERVGVRASAPLQVRSCSVCAWLNHLLASSSQPFINIADWLSRRWMGPVGPQHVLSFFYYMHYLAVISNGWLSGG